MDQDVALNAGSSTGPLPGEPLSREARISLGLGTALPLREGNHHSFWRAE